jgi:hypothetical protein
VGPLAAGAAEDPPQAATVRIRARDARARITLGDLQGEGRRRGALEVTERGLL